MRPAIVSTFCVAGRKGAARKTAQQVALGSCQRKPDPRRQRMCEFVYLPALSHKPNPIKVMTSNTTNAAIVR